MVSSISVDDHQPSVSVRDSRTQVPPPCSSLSCRTSIHPRSRSSSTFRRTLFVLCQTYSKMGTVSSMVMDADETVGTVLEG